MPPELASSRQRGFGLVAALFLILVIAGVIAAMARLAATQHSTSSLALQQARAYQAARAGLEWGMYRVLVDNACPASESFNVPGFAVTVVCQDDGPTIHVVESEAQWGQSGGPDHVYRRVSALVGE